jgi:hypothetical protein
MTPLAAVAAGLLAGAVGTVCPDTAQHVRYRRKGGQDGPLTWAFGPVESWEKAPDPGKVAKRLIEGFTGRALPDRWAWLTSTVMHWTYHDFAIVCHRPPDRGDGNTQRFVLAPRNPEGVTHGIPRDRRYHVWSPARTNISLTATRRSRVTM